MSNLKTSDNYLHINEGARQANGFDCGMYTVLFAQHILSDSFETHNDNFLEMMISDDEKWKDYKDYKKRGKKFRTIKDIVSCRTNHHKKQFISTLHKLRMSPERYYDGEDSSIIKLIRDIV